MYKPQILINIAYLLIFVYYVLFYVTNAYPHNHHLIDKTHDQIENYRIALIIDKLLVKFDKYRV